MKTKAAEEGEKEEVQPLRQGQKNLVRQVEQCQKVADMIASFHVKLRSGADLTNIETD